MYIGDVFKAIMLATVTIVLVLATLGGMTDIGSFLLAEVTK